MTEPTLSPEIRSRLRTAMHQEKLVVIAGAGLSMPPPSSVPSAKELLQSCVDKYERRWGNLPVSAKNSLEALAKYFYETNQYRELFLTELIPWSRFRGDPNRGHFALADFLLDCHVEFVLTTNYDSLVETAATQLRSVCFESSLNASEARQVVNHRPYIKLHGCCVRQKQSTLWFSDQLSIRADFRDLISNIQEIETWLPGNILGRTLVFVGFWSDWSYLNSALVRVLGGSVRGQDPPMVVLVDPEPSESLKTKAPDLWDWASNEQVHFTHIQCSSEEFLDSLRRMAVSIFLGEILALADGTPSAEELDAELNSTPTSDLYLIKRDLHGLQLGDTVTSSRVNQTMSALGSALVRILESGFRIRGPFFDNEAMKCRVVYGAGRSIHLLRESIGPSRFNGDNPDYVVCVGSPPDGNIPDRVLDTGFRGVGMGETSGQRWVTSEDFFEGILA